MSGIQWDPMGSTMLRTRTKAAASLQPGPAKHAQRIDLGTWALAVREVLEVTV
jgi:hypothetical protein